MKLPGKVVLVFREFCLDTAARTLRFRSKDVPIKPKEFDLLAVLASTAGSPVRSEDLVAALWPDQDVSIAALRQSVYRLRQTLAEYDPHNRYIVALPRRGYQFVQWCQQSLNRFGGVAA